MKYIYTTIGAFFISLSFIASAHAQNLDVQVYAGAKDVTVAQFRISAGLEDVEVQRFRVYNDVPNTDAAVSTLDLYSDGLKVGSTYLSQRVGNFDNLSVIIPRDGAKVLTVKANFNSAQQIASIGGTAPRFIFRNFYDGLSDGDIRIAGVSSGFVFQNLTSAQFGGNTLSKTLFVYNAVPVLSQAPTSPTGFRGTAFGNEFDLWEFQVTAPANTSASSPREVVLHTINFTIAGDAEVTDIRVYGPSDNYQSPIAIFPMNHITSPGYTAATTVVPVTFTGSDSKVTYGTTKKYRIRAKVNAPTDSNHPTRSVLIGIENFGTSTSPGDFIWYDNGLPGDNPNTKLVNWLYDPSGNNRLETSPSLSFGSGVAVNPPIVVSPATGTQVPLTAQPPMTTAPLQPATSVETTQKPIVRAPSSLALRRAKMILLLSRNRASTQTFLQTFSRVFGIPNDLPYSYTDVSQSLSVSKYAGIASVYGLFPERGTLTLQPRKPITRAEAIRAIDQFLKNRE